jgi:hypothetical protein
MQTLLTAILKNILEWVAAKVKAWWDRLQEQKSRHAETEAKVEDFKKASDEDAKKKFEEMP